MLINTSRMAHFPRSSLISQGTRNQNLVALSIAEEKYIAFSSCCAQLLWIKQLLEDFGVITNYLPLMCDNTSTLNMVKNLLQHKRTKHFNQSSFLTDNMEKWLILMKFYNIEDQISNIFTKPLSWYHFKRNFLRLN